MRLSASTHRSSFCHGAARLLAALGVAAALLAHERPAAADPTERPAGLPEVVVEKRSRLVAAIPFGVGQFQNGAEGLGVFFASSEALAAAVSIGSAIMVYRLADTDVTRRTHQGQEVDVTALNRQIVETAWVNRISVGTWAALAVIGVIEAQVSFVPERRTVRMRNLTGSTPSLRPLFSVDARGGELGIVGRF